MSTNFQAVRDTAARLAGGVDAVLDAEDPLPFLALHYGQVGPLCAGSQGLSSVFDGGVCVFTNLGA